MIKDSKMLTLAEVKEELSKREEQAEENDRISTTLAYAKKFSKIKVEEVEKMKKEMKDLDILQLRERYIVKIIDLLPKDDEDLKKVFVGEDVSLGKNEIEKILEVVKKYK